MVNAIRGLAGDVCIMQWLVKAARDLASTISIYKAREGLQRFLKDKFHHANADDGW